MGSSEITDGTITTSDITDGTIANVDISSSAAISPSKLATAIGGQVLLANVAGVVTATTISGDATVSSNGVATLTANSVSSSKIADGTIVDADVSAGAALLDTKLAQITSAGKVADSAVSANVALMDRTNIFSKVVKMTAVANAATISIGERWRDNSIVAWARVASSGTSDSSFGVSLVTNNAPGVYTITLNASFGSSIMLIPMAVAEVDIAPTTATTARILTVNQSTSTEFQVFINNGNWTLVNNDFVFMVTGR